MGLERLLADLAAAEFVPPNGEAKQTAVRVTVCDVATDQVLSVSTATLVRVNVCADCVRQNSAIQCARGLQAPPGAAPAPTTKEL